MVDQFFQQKKLDFFSFFQIMFVWVGSGSGSGLGSGLGQAFFLLQKLVDHIKSHDNIFPDFYTCTVVSSIIIQ